MVGVCLGLSFEHVGWPCRPKTQGQQQSLTSVHLNPSLTLLADTVFSRKAARRSAVHFKAACCG